ncbi:MAG: C40 family peptidase [Steroidobacteraceae bacterium]
MRPHAPHRARTYRAGRNAAVVLVALLLAACAPFQRGEPGAGGAGPGAAALRIAETRIGAPYRYGGAGPDAFDCSGLVSYAYSSVGIRLPRTAAQQYAAVRPVPRKDLEPGDLVFFRVDGSSIGHVGIYAGDGRFVDAPQTGGRVRVVSLDDPWYRERYAGAGRPY